MINDKNALIKNCSACNSSPKYLQFFLIRDNNNNPKYPYNYDNNNKPIINQ